MLGIALHGVGAALAAAWALRDDLDAIIKKSEVMGMAVAIPMELYNRIRNTEVGAKEIFSEDAFESALQSLIKQCAETHAMNLVEHG